MKPSLVIAIAIVAAVLLAALFSGCDEKKSPVLMPSATRPLSSVGAAQGSAEALQLDLANAASALKRYAKVIFDALMSWRPEDPVGQAAKSDAFAAVGGVDRTADVIASKDEQISKLKDELWSAQQGIIDLGDEWRQTYDRDMAEKDRIIIAETKRADDANAEGRKWFTMFMWGLAALGVIGFAGSFIVTQTVGPLLGKSIAVTGVILMVVCPAMVWFTGLGDKIVANPTVPWAIGAVIISVAAVIVAFVVHRALKAARDDAGAMRAIATDIVTGIHAVKNIEPATSPALKRVAAQQEPTRKFVSEVEASLGVARV